MELDGIKAVIFDMDGVLTDSEPLINAAAVAMFREKGLTVQPDDFLPFVGTGEDRYISGVAEHYGFPLDIPAAKKRTYEIYLELVPSKLEAFPGAAELVGSCRSAGLKVALASSADSIKIEANLRKIGLPVEEWDAVVSAEDVLRKKPAPDIFLAAAKKLGLAPAECAVIEDAVNGVAAAKAAGMRCIAVTHTFPGESLAAADLIRSQISSVTVADLRGVEASEPGAPHGPTPDTVSGADAILKPSSEPAPGSAATPPHLANEPAPPLLPMAGSDSNIQISAPAAPGSPAPPRPWSFFQTIGLGLVIGAGFMFAQSMVAALFGVASAVLDKSAPSLETANGLLWAVATLFGAPVMACLSWLFASRRHGISAREYLALKPVPGRQLLGWCLVLVVFMAAMDTFTVLIDRPIVPDVMVDAYQTAGFVPLLWVALVVFAPVGEEIFFRGFLFKGILHSKLGRPGAVLLVSLVFAAIHLQYDLYGILLVFCTGLLLGYARVHTGSIYPTIVMHALMNLIATIEVVLKIHWQK